MFKGYKYEAETLEVLKGRIAGLRERFDLPFDELYHKEKKLIDQVVKATQALKMKESTLPNPFGEDRMYDPETLSGNILLDKSHSNEH